MLCASRPDSTAAVCCRLVRPCMVVGKLVDLLKAHDVAENVLCLCGSMNVAVVSIKSLTRDRMP